MGRLIRIRSGVSCVSVAVPGEASEKSGVLLPFCSIAMSRREKRDFGVSAVTSSVASTPMVFAGWTKVIVGATPRPATK